MINLFLGLAGFFACLVISILMDNWYAGRKERISRMTVKPFDRRGLLEDQVGRALARREQLGEEGNHG